jgi:peptide chain release factor subunit 3
MVVGFEKGGQTREHVLLAKSLGIQKLVVIINKMDEKSVKWDEDRYLAIKKDLTKFLQHVGYNVEKNVIWLPMSGLTGENIMEKVEGGRCSWYDGPTLLQLLDDMRVPRRQMDPSFIRIPVLDKLKDRGIDIFGKVQSGTIKLGTKLVLMPSKLPVEVLSILNGEEQNVAYAKTGENIKVLFIFINQKYSFD